MPVIKFDDKLFDTVQLDRITHEWGLYRRFLDLQTQRMVQSEEEWEKAIDAEAAQITDAYSRADFYEYHSDEYEERLQFREILMYSFFSASFAQFEKHLLMICTRAQRRCNSSFAVDDLKSNSAMTRAKAYLSKLGIRFPSKGEEWAEISRYGRIRNKIMHEGGIVAPEGHDRDYAKCKGITASGGSRLQYALTLKFCVEALTNFEGFLLQLHCAYLDGVDSRAGQ